MQYQVSGRYFLPSIWMVSTFLGTARPFLSSYTHSASVIQEPSFAYLRTCSQGYKDFGIDTKPLMKAYRKSKGGER